MTLEKLGDELASAHASANNWAMITLELSAGHSAQTEVPWRCWRGWGSSVSETGVEVSVADRRVRFERVAKATKL